MAQSAATLGLLCDEEEDSLGDSSDSSSRDSDCDSDESCEFFDRASKRRMRRSGSRERHRAAKAASKWRAAQRPVLGERPACTSQRGDRAGVWGALLVDDRSAFLGGVAERLSTLKDGKGSTSLSLTRKVNTIGVVYIQASFGASRSERWSSCTRTQRSRQRANSNR